jgi:hypothetical protein
MTVLRFLAGLCLIAAVIALVSDATRPLLGIGPFTPTSLGKLWADAAPRSLAAARTAVSQGISPLAWNWLAASVLALPTFVLLGLAGICLGLLGRRRRRIDVFIN